MKRTLIILGALSVGTAYSQSHKVGINTDNPRASLEVSKAAGIAATEVQGLLLPQLTQAERNAMDQTKFVKGLQIYNTDKNCVDIWNGINWQCIDGTKQDNQGDSPSSPSAVLHITQLGFSGVYKGDEALTSDNTVTFKIKNNGAVTSPTMNLSGAVTITNEPGGDVAVVGGQHYSVTIAAGREVTLTYRLQGTPKVGTLSARLTYNSLYAQATTNVSNDTDPAVPQYVTLGSGERSFVSVYDKDYWPYSGPTTNGASTLPQFVDGNFNEPTVNIQGKITTTGTEVYIPITVDPIIGSATITMPAFPGSEIDVSDTYTEGQTGKKIKLSWESQQIDAFSTYIKAKISAVDSDYLIKKLDFQTGMGKDYLGIKIGDFTYAANESGTVREKFTVRIMSGIPDRRFAIKTKDNGGNDVYDHQFIYVPVKIPDAGIYKNDSNLVNKVWLNNNLGAEYTRVGSSVFDPGQQAKDHSDHNAFGSLWQYGRPADGHELVDYTVSPWQFKYGTTTTPTTTYPPQPTENKTVVPNVTTDPNTGVDTTPMWFAGIAKPSGFPITGGHDNNNVCPYGFIMSSHINISPIIRMTKAYDFMKEFLVRLPSNPKNVTDVEDYGEYFYGPKLWTWGNTGDIRYFNRVVNGSNNVTQSFFVYAGTTDYYWGPTQQRWGTNLNNYGFYEPSSDTNDDISYFRFRKKGTSSLRIYYSSYIGTSYGVPRSINDSYAIRCIKQ